MPLDNIMASADKDSSVKIMQEFFRYHKENCPEAWHPNDLGNILHGDELGITAGTQMLNKYMFGFAHNSNDKLESEFKG